MRLLDSGEGTRDCRSWRNSAGQVEGDGQMTFRVRRSESWAPICNWVKLRAVLPTLKEGTGKQTGRGGKG